MKTILCLFAKEMNAENEEAVMCYDDDDTMIHILTDMTQQNISIGMVLSIYEQLNIGKQGETEIWIMSDMPILLQYTKMMLGGLFDAYMRCPVPTDDLEYMNDHYCYLKQCDKENYKLLLLLIGKLQIIKQFTRTKEYYIHDRMLMKMLNDLSTVLEECESLYHKMCPNSKDVFECFTEEYACSEDGMVFKFLCFSFLLQVSWKPIYVQRIYDETRNHECTIENKLFLCNQIKRLSLLHPEIGGGQYAQRLYEEAVSYWKTVFFDFLKPITFDKRNKDIIVILTLQFLGTTHAPTKTANERIYTIGKQMGKEVLCINTREQYTTNGFLPFYNATIRSIEKEYNGGCRMQHKDYLFNYFQPETEMPDRAMMHTLLQEIRRISPWKVVVLGDKCLLGDLCADMIPTVCIPMAFSTIPKKVNQYVAIGKQLSDYERASMEQAGYQMSSVIESTFTFELIEQTTKLTREELCLPVESFLLAVVGIRLDSEVTKPFLDMLRQISDSEIYVVFAGEYERYEDDCTEDIWLREHSSFVGYQDDILAFLELCDLYVNPPRTGGGFSVVEAFYKGLPGVTLGYGDVAASAGLDFCVSDLDEMRDMIIRYKDDKDFYHMMSKKALLRSEELFDSKAAMEHILNEMEKRELWF